MSLRVTPYRREHRQAWNAFVAASKNATFLLDRGYLEYHSDRFRDASLLVWGAGEQLVALLPASRHEEEVRSHGGLTYGGVVAGERMGASLMLEVFDALLATLRADGATALLYKPIPHIYHRLPAEEDLYALFRCGAQLVRRDASASLRAGQAAPLTKGRRWAIHRGRERGLRGEESRAWGQFMALEAALLAERHGALPVHTGEELAALATAFPGNIRLFTVARGDELLAGTVVYETPKVAHTQYIGSTAEGRASGALDVLFSWLLGEVYAAKPWFDFGISTDQGGLVLNAGLAANKESWGARTTVYDWYSVAV